MELTKNIFFNTDKLIENSTVKISYTGKFFQDASEEVFIHYGFGNSWENLNELKMIKTELGFQSEINLLEGDTFNFCFRNNINEWDNNGTANYVFPLERMEMELISLDDEDFSITKRKGLRKSYILGKKIRLAFYKLINFIPRMISENYKKKLSENN